MSELHLSRRASLVSLPQAALAQAERRQAPVEEARKPAYVSISEEIFDTLSVGGRFAEKVEILDRYMALQKQHKTRGCPGNHILARHATAMVEMKDLAVLQNLVATAL